MCVALRCPARVATLCVTRFDTCGSARTRGSFSLRYRASHAFPAECTSRRTRMRVAITTQRRATQRQCPPRARADAYGPTPHAPHCPLRSPPSLEPIAAIAGPTHREVFTIPTQESTTRTWASTGAPIIRMPPRPRAGRATGIQAAVLCNVGRNARAYSDMRQGSLQGGHRRMQRRQARVRSKRERRRGRVQADRSTGLLHAQPRHGRSRARRVFEARQCVVPGPGETAGILHVVRALPVPLESSIPRTAEKLTIFYNR